MAEETAEQQLAKMRRQMARALRRGDTSEYEKLASAYADLKGQHVEQVHRERKEAERARRAALRAAEAQQQEPVVPREPERWRLPRGFASPLAEARARSGIGPREEPSRPPAGGLRPWRRDWPWSGTQIWRP